MTAFSADDRAYEAKLREWIREDRKALQWARAHQDWDKADRIAADLSIHESELRLLHAGA